MLIFAFLLSSIYLIVLSLLLNLKIMAFAPFISLALLKTPFHQGLWLSCLAGSLMDLISSDPMGLHALNYTLCFLLLSKLKKHLLFEDPLHLSLLTLLFSCCSTFFQLFLLFLFDRRIPFQGQWVLVDIFLAPLLDGLFALIWFTAPLLAFSRLKRKWDLFWIKRQNLSQTSR